MILLRNDFKVLTCCSFNLCLECNSLGFSHSTHFIVNPTFFAVCTLGGKGYCEAFSLDPLILMGDIFRWDRFLPTSYGSGSGNSSAPRNISWNL